MTLRYNTDFYKTDQSALSIITPDDPRWMGAWWLGFLVLGVVILILTIPIFMFPRRLSAENNNNVERDISESEDAVVINIASAYRAESFTRGKDFVGVLQGTFIFIFMLFFFLVLRVVCSYKAQA